MVLPLEISLANILMLTRLPYVFILNGEDEYWKQITLWELSAADRHVFFTLSYVCCVFHFLP